MILQIFTVYDDKTAAYLAPFYDQSIGAALRSFDDTCRLPDHVFNKHSADFTLFHIGQFDDGNCEFTIHETKHALATAAETIAQFTQPLKEVVNDE